MKTCYMLLIYFTGLEALPLNMHNFFTCIKMTALYNIQNFLLLFNWIFWTFSFIIIEKFCQFFSGYLLSDLSSNSLATGNHIYDVGGTKRPMCWDKGNLRLAGKFLSIFFSILIYNILWVFSHKNCSLCV